jgi:hypothetical protein
MKESFLIILFIIAILEKNQAQVGVSEDGSIPHKSAILDVNSKRKGLLLPRNPDPAAYVPNPAAGLVVYNETDKNINYFNGTNWNGLASINTSNNTNGGLYGRFPNSKGFFSVINSYTLNQVDITFKEYSWVVPAGITKIWVEAWSGGQAGGFIPDGRTNMFEKGGKAGNFGSFIIDVIPNETLNIKVGKGGFFGVEDNVLNAGMAGFTTITAISGTFTIGGEKFIVPNPLGGSTYLNPSEFNGLINFIEGEDGSDCSRKFHYDRFVVIQSGKGGDAYPNQKGGQGIEVTFRNVNTNPQILTVGIAYYSNSNGTGHDGSMPGGGGGVGSPDLGKGGKGGPGLVILHW